jgi:nickel transport protein
MKKILAILILALILSSGLACGHRMFVGQRVTVELTGVFDDGEPAADASVRVYRDGELYAENKTDSTGRLTLVLPGKGTGDWRFLVSGSGHEEEAFLSIRNDVAPGAVAAAGMALVIAPAAFFWRRRSGR